MLTRIAAVLLLLGLANGSIANGLDAKVEPEAAGMNRERLGQIPRRMQEFVDAGKVAGVVTILARHGHIASFEAVGHQDAQTPMRRDTIFRIASMTKPIACAAIMLLVDDGRLSVVDPVSKFIPAYRDIKINPCGARAGYECKSVAPSRPINLEDLMAHTSGLSEAPDDSQPRPRSLAELTLSGASTRLLFDPGTSWNYSNLGYDILGRVVELIAKQPFDAFLAERIFRPLGMTDTSFFLPPDKKGRMAALYTYEGDRLKEVPSHVPSTPPSIPSPAGGLVSTALDMLRFNEMMRNHGVLNGHRFLSAAAVQLMTSSHTGTMKAGWVPGVGHGYGYEVVRDVAGMFRYNSVGSFVKGGAYRTYEWVDPDKDLVGILLMQRTNGDDDITDELNSFMAMSAAAIE